MRRGDPGGFYAGKKPVRHTDHVERVTDDVIHGRIDAREALARYKALGATAAEVRRISRARSQQAERQVSHRLGQAFSAVTLPLTGQTASETRRVVATNLSRGHRGDPRRLAVEDQQLGIGMAAWVPGGNPLRRAGARVWNNGRLVERAERAAAKAPTPQEKVFGAMGEAKKVQREQEVLRRRERARRGEAQQRAAEQVGGIEGHLRAKQELRGELPKLQFGALRDRTLSHGEVQKLLNHINDHPELKDWEKFNAREALLNVVEGKQAPRPSEIKWMERLFGPEKAQELAHPSSYKRISESVVNLINVPRALKSSFDISAPFRQGLVVFAGHPILAGKNLRPMISALRKEGAYDDLMRSIAERPNYELYQRGKLALTDTEHLATREEAFIGANYAEKLTGGKHSPVRASGRAYAGFLNKTRADLFDYMVDVARREGIDVESEKFLRKTAGFVNTATGRGNLGHFEEGLKYANALFFSPRLIASRLNLLFNPAYYVGKGAEGRIARREARRAMRNLLGAGSLVLWLAKQSGAEVGMDPRSADFGKIRIGDTRIDIWGGFQQYIVAADRILKGERVNSSTGAVTPIIDENEGADNLISRGWSVTKDLGQLKFAPVPGYINAYRKGRTFEGDDFDPLTEAGRLFLPIGFESTYDTYKNYGIGPAAAGFGINAIGIGVNTYRQKEKKARGGSGGGGGFYGGGGSSGGGGFYGRP